MAYLFEDDFNLAACGHDFARSDFELGLASSTVGNRCDQKHDDETERARYREAKDRQICGGSFLVGVGIRRTSADAVHGEEGD